MTADADLAIRRKRLGFRCWHRGSREADLLFGRFADRHLDRLDPAQLDRLEALLARDDPDVWAWVTGRVPVPPELDTDVLAMMREGPFGPEGTCATSPS